MTNLIIALVALGACSGFFVGYFYGWLDRGERAVARREGNIIIVDGPIDLDMLRDIREAWLAEPDLETRVRRHQ